MNELYNVSLRLVTERLLVSKKKIRSPQDAVEIIAQEYKYLDRETLFSVNLNTHNQPINFVTVTLGDVEKVEFNPKPVLKAALLSNAYSVLLIHNHPTGDCMPSTDDLEATRFMEMACEIVGIKMFDHIVIGHDGYYSIVGNEKFEYGEDQLY